MDFGVEDLDKDPIFQSLGDITQMLPDPSVNEDCQDSRAWGTPAAQSKMARVDEKEVTVKKAASADVGKYCPSNIDLFSALFVDFLLFQMSSQRISPEVHLLPLKPTEHCRRCYKRRLTSHLRGQLLLLAGS